MEKRTPISVKLPPSLLKELDAYIRRLPHATTRTAVIEDGIRAMIARSKKTA